MKKKNGAFTCSHFRNPCGHEKGLSPFVVTLLAEASLDRSLSLLDHRYVLRLALNRDGMAPGLERGHSGGPATGEAVQHDVALVGEDLDQPAGQ